MGKKIYVSSLGCSKNLVDSEIMLGLLKKREFEITGDAGDADVIIVNTCGFILPAKEESIETILNLARHKQTGKCRVLIATGCLVEKYRQELMQEIPELDGVLGTSEFQQITGLVESKLQGVTETCPNFPEHELYMSRFITTPGHTAYVKIADGCNNICTYCLIPQLRGAYRSRPMESIVEEVRQLVQRGVKEINLIAQDTTYYGVDLYGRMVLPELLKRLAGEKIPWIRLLYGYPLRVSDELLDVMAAHDNICRYFDLPIQHASDPILKRMGRKESREYLLSLFQKIRQKMPDAALRTTCMVGFPGETDDDFQSLLDFITEVRFDWLGAFSYSREEDTPAFRMRNQVKEEIKEVRYHQLMSQQTEISLSKREKFVGKTIFVLIEGKSLENPEYFIGRTQYHAPDVDGIVLVKGRCLPIGEIVRVHITSCDIYDLIGEISVE